MSNFLNDYLASDGYNAATDARTQRLAARTVEKTQRIGQPAGIQLQDDMLLGMSDADSLQTELFPKTRSSATDGTRYDAIELQHGTHPYDMSGITKQERDTNKIGKSKYSMLKQRYAVANILGKDMSELTEQDMIDVGNQQQIQKLADIVRTDGEERWIAPLIRGVEQTNLTGHYQDENGNYVNAPLNIKIQTLDTGKNTKDRDIVSFVNPSTGINVTDAAAHDPAQNAFANPQFRGYQHSTDKGSIFGEATGSLIGSAVGGLADTANFMEDVVIAAAGDYGRNENGTRKDGFITDKNVQDFTRDAKAKFGYTLAAQEADSVEIEHLMNNWKNANTNSEKASAAWDLFTTGATDIGMLGSSLGMVGSAVATGGVMKSAAQYGAKKLLKSATKNAMRASADARQTIKTVKASKVLNTTEKAEKIAEAKKAVMFGEQVTALASASATPAAYGMMMANQDMAELRANGVEPTLDRYAASFFTQALAVGLPELQALKFGLSGRVVNSAGKVLNGTKIKDDLVKFTLGVGTHIAAATGVEFAQETLQGIVQNVNQKWGTKEYEGKSIIEVALDTLNDSIGQGILGAGAGGTMGAVGAVGGPTIKGTVSAAELGINKARTRNTEQAPATKVFKNHVKGMALVDEMESYLAANGTKVVNEAHKADVLASMDGVIANMTTHLEALSNNTLDDIGEADRERLSTAYGKAVLYRKHILGGKSGEVLNNRPVKEIQADINALETVEETPETVATRKVLLAEKAISQYREDPNFGQKVKTKTGAINFNDALNLKFFGGTYNDKQRLGMMEYVQLLTDPNMPEALAAEYRMSLDKFMSTQASKQDALEKAKREWDELPEDKKVPIQTEFQGDKGAIKAFYNGSNENSKKFLLDMQAENAVMQQIVSIIDGNEGTVVNEPVVEDIVEEPIDVKMTGAEIQAARVYNIAVDRYAGNKLSPEDSQFYADNATEIDKQVLDIIKAKSNGMPPIDEGTNEYADVSSGNTPLQQRSKEGTVEGSIGVHSVIDTEVNNIRNILAQIADNGYTGVAEAEIAQAQKAVIEYENDMEGCK